MRKKRLEQEQGQDRQHHWIEEGINIDYNHHNCVQIYFKINLIELNLVSGNI